MQIANNGCTYQRCGALAIIFIPRSKLRSLNIEDNFNNTFFGKILPHTTAVATEFRAKVTQISQTTKQTTTNNPHKSHKTHKEYNRYEDENENEDETHPPPLRYALVQPVSGGQLAGAVIT